MHMMCLFILVGGGLTNAIADRFKVWIILES